MRNDTFKIIGKTDGNFFYLRTIIESDLEILRVNKNKNKNSFFLKEDITEEQQKKWFEKISEEKENFMFVCIEDDKTFGCIGFRNLGEVIDVYNVMRFEPSKTSMAKCINVLIEEINKQYKYFPIQVIVLKDNPAIDWYKKVGFYTEEEMESSVKMYYKK